MQREHTYTVDGIINGRRRGGGGGAYIRSYIFVGKWMGLYTPGGTLKWDFTVGQILAQVFQVHAEVVQVPAPVIKVPAQVARVSAEVSQVRVQIDKVARQWPYS